MQYHRRQFLITTSLYLGGMTLGCRTKKPDQSVTISPAAKVRDVAPLQLSLPDLGYDYSALEPFIDAETMKIHHTKHHAAYVTNFNKAATESNLAGLTLEQVLANTAQYSASIRNNGGGHYNHTAFWQMMHPNGAATFGGRIADTINANFGSLEKFQEKFTEVAMKRFGSGWAWLVQAKDGKLLITSTPNQDNPLMDVSEVKGKILLGLDVWEHAYYLKYQNKRADYIKAWWNVVNWNKVAALLT